MSDGSRPASAIACFAAATVSVIGSTMRRRPTFDMPMPVMATSSSNFFAPLGIGRATSGRLVDRGERTLLGVAGRLEQRDPHVLVVLEAYLHLHAHEHVDRVRS